MILCFFFWAGSAFAGSQDLGLKLKSGNYVQKVDNVYIIIDKSGSMLESYAGQDKFDIEKKLVGNFNRTIPDMNLKAAVQSFGNNFIDFDMIKLNYGIEKYDTEAVDKVIKKLCCPFGDSNLGVAITLAGTGLSKVPGKSAIVIFSDGKDMTDVPVKAAQIVKRMLGDSVCIHTVQIGNDEDGADLLDKIAKTGKCGIAKKGDNLASDAAMTDFVEKIFLESAPSPAK
jgi:OOP family OmpA-OmpF porin